MRPRVQLMRAVLVRVVSESWKGPVGVTSSLFYKCQPWGSQPGEVTCARSPGQEMNPRPPSPAAVRRGCLQLLPETSRLGLGPGALGRAQRGFCGKGARTPAGI